MKSGGNTFGKDRLNRSLVVNLIIPLLLVVVIACIFGYYYQNQKQQLIKNADTVMVDTAESMVSELAATIDLAKNSIATISASVSQNMTGPELTNPDDILTPLEENSPFDSLEYIQADGMNVMSVAGIFDSSDREYYIRGIKGETGIWNNYNPKHTQDTLMDFYAPLMYDGNPVGVIVGYIRATAQIGHRLKVSLYGQPVECVLLDRDGMVVCSSLQKDFVPDYTVDMYLNDAGFDGEQSEQLKKLLQDETDGCVAFDDESGQGRLCVMSVPDTDMMAAMIVPASSVNTVLKDFTRPTTRIFAVLLLILAVYVIFLIIANRREIRRVQDERKRIEAEIIKGLNEQLKESHKSLTEYNDAMANAGYGMWHIILKDGVNPRMQVNDKMAELLGIVGKDLGEEELYNAWYDQIVPDAIPSVQASVGEMIAGNFSENTYRWTHPTKGVIYVRCGGTAVKLEDGTNVLSGYHADVTDIVQKEEQKKEELTRIKNAALLENEIISSISKMYFAIFRIDILQNYYEEIASDDSVHIITGHEGNAQEKMNELCASFVTDEYRDDVREFFDLSTIQERLQDLDTVEYQYHATDGNWHEARFIAKKRNESGTVTHILYVTRIISAIKQKELETQEALRIAKEGAEAANAAKSAFLFNMSHDIRTPMNAIIGYANLMKRSPGNMEKWPDYLDKIIVSGEFLLGLINNVLEMARIESGRMTLDENVYDANALANQFFMVFADEMGKKDIKFTQSIEVEHRYFCCDNVKLKEILMNIVSNAQKYTMPGGSVNVTVKEMPSDVDGYALIETTVSDTGIGMSEEFLPHLFEEFTREHNSSGNKIQGTGLGMPIVKKLTELMGGTIEVRSKIGEGSTFIVTIPHRIAEKPASADKNEKSDYYDFTGKRILLAEDNDLNAEIAIEILSEYGFKVERAEDGVACVDMLNRSEEGYYDLILMDVQMPKLDGYGATRMIRQMGDFEKADIPIIAMTANAFDEDKRDALEAGMDGHVAKPIRIPVLIETLGEVFRDRSAVKNIIATPKQKEDPVSHVKRIYFEMQRSKAVSVLPGGFFAYEAAQPEKLIFANELCCSIWGCANFEEFNELVGGSFKGIVHPDDYERAEKEIWHQIDNGDMGLDQVKYRIIKKDGTVSHVDDYGRLIRDENVGDIFYVFVAETPEGI